MQRGTHGRGVAVLTLPGDVGGLELPEHTPAAFARTAAARAVPDPEAVRAAADAIDGAERVTLLVGQGARDAREEVLALAERLARADGADAQGQGGPGARQRRSRSARAG